MGRYLDIIQGKTQPSHEPVDSDVTARKAINARKGLADAVRDLPPDELARMDLRFRILAPGDADGWSLQDWLDWIEERSAILEFDADHERDQADQEAFLMWRLFRKETS